MAGSSCVKDYGIVKYIYIFTIYIYSGVSIGNNISMETNAAYPHRHGVLATGSGEREKLEHFS